MLWGEAEAKNSGRGLKLNESYRPKDKISPTKNAGKYSTILRMNKHKPTETEILTRFYK